MTLCSALSHPIWKSCFFPCGPGVLFTGDSRAGNGAHKWCCCSEDDVHAIHLESKSHNFGWLIFRCNPCIQWKVWKIHFYAGFESLKRQFPLAKASFQFKVTFANLPQLRSSDLNMMLSFTLFVVLSDLHTKIDHVNQRPPFCLTLKTLNTFETLGNVYPQSIPRWQPHFKVSN